jgi:hypothetical protein
VGLGGVTAGLFALVIARVAALPSRQAPRWLREHRAWFIGGLCLLTMLSFGVDAVSGSSVALTTGVLTLVAVLLTSAFVYDY